MGKTKGRLPEILGLCFPDIPWSKFRVFGGDRAWRCELSSVFASLSGLSELRGGKLFRLLESPGEGNEKTATEGNSELGELRDRGNLLVLLVSLIGFSTLMDVHGVDVTTTPWLFDDVTSTPWLCGDVDEDTAAEDK